MGRVTVQTVPCTSLHGIGADEVMVSGHLPLAVGDFRWADAVTVHARRVCTVTFLNFLTEFDERFLACPSHSYGIITQSEEYIKAPFFKEV